MIEADYHSRAGRRRLYNYLGWLRRGSQRHAAKAQFMDNLRERMHQKLRETASDRRKLPRNAKTGRYMKP